MSDVNTREQLANYAHEAWAGWMRYLFEKCGAGPSGEVVIPAGYADALRRQMTTPYAELSEAEKDSDRAEAAAMLTIVGAALTAAPPAKLQTCLNLLIEASEMIDVRVEHTPMCVRQLSETRICTCDVRPLLLGIDEALRALAPTTTRP